MSLALCSVLGAVAEAAFLLLITRAAFSATKGESGIALFGTTTLTYQEFGLVALGLIVVRVAFALFASSLSATLTSQVVATMRTSLAVAYLRGEFAAQHGQRGGKLQELLTTFVNKAAGAVMSASQLIIALSSLVALLAAAVFVDPLTALVVIVALAGLGAALIPVRRALLRQSARTSSAGMGFATGLSELSQLGMEMHVFNVQAAMQKEIEQLVADNQGKQQRFLFLRGVVPAVYSGLAYVALVAALVLVASIESADVQAVGAIMLVMLRSLTYGQSTQSALAGIAASRPFVEELSKEVNYYEKARRSLGEVELNSVGEIGLESVSFGYNPEKIVLRDLTASIRQGEVIGVVGPSGSGKSTFVQLLLGLRVPTSGKVLSAGRDIRSLDAAEWARKVTFVPQQPRLIAGSVADNIRFLREGISDADVVRASKAANLHDDVQGFEGQYERQVGEQGSHLSGGQQQRLIIARALVAEPDVLILDEPTSALDVRSESLIRRTLEELGGSITIVIIAHRLSTLEACDRIMVVQDGEIKGFDTPERLERSNEFYAESLRLSGLR